MLVDPILQAEFSEQNQNELKFTIKDLNSNITRLK